MDHLYCGGRMMGWLFKSKVFRAGVLAAAVVFGAGVKGNAVEAEIGVFVSPDSVTVGDVIAMEVIINAAQNAVVTMPNSRDFGEFTVLSRDSARARGAFIDTVKYRYNLTTFRPQDLEIPQLQILIETDTTIDAEPVTLTDTIFIDPIPITVISAIPQDSLEAGVGLRDLKKQQTTGRGSLWWLWLIGAIALATLAYFLIKKFAKTRGADDVVVPLKPPYEEAMDAIAALENKNYLALGFIREYSFELSEIFKRYIGRRYNTIASELTTEEIVEWFKGSEVTTDMRLCAEKFLRMSDMVKFAKWKPDTQTLDSFIVDVKLFLNTTKPQEIAEEKTQEETTGGQT